jgi:ABC-type sulfate transport system permease component
MGSFLVLFILIPIVNLMLSSDLNSIIANLQDSQVISSIFISVYSALAATLIAVLFGVPLAYILARHDFFGKGFVESIIDIPIVIPHTVSGIALPLALRSIVVGSILCGARAISEFGAIIILSFYPLAASTLIYTRFVQFGLSDSTPVAIILISICLTLFIIVRIIIKGWRSYDKN